MAEPEFLSVLAAAGAQAQTLDRIRDSGSFKIGYREDAAPFAYKDALGEAAGYSVELCRTVAANVKETLGLAQMTVEYVPVTTEDRFQAVQDGRIDLLCGATTVTLSRRELVDFSLFTFIDGAGVLLRRDGPQDFEGLAGTKVGVRRATTTEAALSSALAQQGLEVEVVPVESHEDGLAKLRAGEVQAYFADRGILVYLLLRSGCRGPVAVGTAVQLRALRAGARPRRPRLPAAGRRHPQHALPLGRDRPDLHRRLRRQRPAERRPEGALRDQRPAA